MIKQTQFGYTVFSRSGKKLETYDKYSDAVKRESEIKRFKSKHNEDKHIN